LTPFASSSPTAIQTACIVDKSNGISKALVFFRALHIVGKPMLALMT
jgi:hypothetical protein